MRESSIENYATDCARQRGGLAEKWGVNGWQDRIILLPARVGFLELKRPGEELRPLQVSRMNTLLRLGLPVGWADSYATVDRFMDRLCST
jgi:hypothetical protein